MTGNSSMKDIGGSGVKDKEEFAVDYLRISNGSASTASKGQSSLVIPSD